jgi:hypothetical protein
MSILLNRVSIYTEFGQSKMPNLVVQFPRTKLPQNFQYEYGLSKWYDGLESTVSANTGEIESTRMYFYRIPHSELLQITPRLATDQIHFKILQEGVSNCEFE